MGFEPGFNEYIDYASPQLKMIDGTGSLITLIVNISEWFDSDS